MQVWRNLARGQEIKQLNKPLKNTIMKTIQITMKDGKIYTGVSNCKIYAGSIYLNRPENGFITVTENGATTESFRKQIIISVNDILKTISL